jgi:hypothetical protein
MISRTFLCTALALVASTTSSAAEDRELQSTGVNLCAAYDIVVPLIAGGMDSCECEGRDLLCNFDEICNIDNVCASLKMDIDFSSEDYNEIVYTATYSDKALPEVVLALDVSAGVEAGIQGCTATMGEEGCDVCEPCSDGRGVKIGCSSGAIECQQVDVANFERYVPFFGVSLEKTISAASVEVEETDNSASSTTTTTVAVVAALLAFAVAL